MKFEQDDPVRTADMAPARTAPEWLAKSQHITSKFMVIILVSQVACTVDQQHNDESIDPAATVVTKMREQGISSLPRNYELVYQFLNTTNSALIREFAALGQRPTQSQLDEVGKKFLPHHHGASTAELARERISDEMKGVIRLFIRDRSKLQRYSTLLGETSSRISEKAAPSFDTLSSFSKTLSSATGDTIDKSEAVINEIVVRARELAQLKTELEEYKRLAVTDPITKLSNRRAFDQRLAAIYDDPKNTMHHALLVADIDHFKMFNDTYGHQVGDRVLSVAAAMMKNSLDKDAFVARTGGEEFAVIMKGTSLEAALEAAERMRRAIEATQLKNHNEGVDCGSITMSMGLCMSSDALSAEDLYRNADRALYEAKNAGRNQVKIYTPKLKRALAFLKR